MNAVEMVGKTNQDDASITFAGALGLWFFGADAQLLARRADCLDAVALDSEDVDLVGLDLKHLRRRIWVDKGCLGQGHALALRLWLLN